MGDVVILALLAGCTGSPLPPGEAQRPDIVLVSIDSLRPDHLGTYGYPRATSPFIDVLAKSGTVFDEAWTHSPWTLPSHVTMLSGRSPFEHEVIEDDRRIPDSLPLVSEAFRAAGYATGGFVAAVYVSKLYGFERGFDHFEDYGITEKKNLQKPNDAKQVVTDALSFAKSADKKPIFLFLHLYDVHYPYLPPEPYNSQFDKPGTRKSTQYRKYEHYFRDPIAPGRMLHLVAQYDETIAYVDAQLARLHAAFEQSGRNVRFVITADHGEEFAERGSWGHAHTLHPEVMRIPLIVSGGTAGTRDATVARGMDIAATVAALGGVSFASSGVDLLAEGADATVRDVAMETCRFDSARLGLLTSAGGESMRVDVDFLRSKSMAYDHSTDPREQNELPSPDPALLANALALAGQHWTATGSVTSTGWMWTDGDPKRRHGVESGPFSVYPPDAVVSGPATRDMPLPPSIKLTDSTKEQLEALGYQQ